MFLHIYLIKYTKITCILTNIDVKEEMSNKDNKKLTITCVTNVDVHHIEGLQQYLRYFLKIGKPEKVRQCFILITKCMNTSELV